MPTADVIQELLALDVGLARVDSTVVERPWGLLCFNQDNPHHYDSNSARQIRAAAPAEAIAEIAAFYRARGLTPRVKCNDLTWPPGFEAELRAAGWRDSMSVTRVMRWQGGPVVLPALPAGVVIERAGPQDLRELADVQAAGFGGDTLVWITGSLRRELSHPAMRWYLARVDGIAAAAAAMFDGDGAGLITNVATAPSYRGRGLATALVVRAQAEARGPLLLEVVEPNAERIYGRAGFVSEGEIAQTMYWLEPDAHAANDDT